MYYIKHQNKNAEINCSSLRITSPTAYLIFNNFKISIKIGGTKAVYRVRKEGPHGGYKMISEDTNTNASREDLLFMRSKKKSDRHCS